MGRIKTRFLTALLCLCLVASFFGAYAPSASADTLVSKVLSTISYEPVALMQVDYITADTSTGSVYITDYTWYDQNGVPIRTKFGTGPATVNITFATHDGYVFDDRVEVYLNNARVNYVLSPDRHYLTLDRSYDPMIWAPSVMKNPSDEYVEEGGLASFVATASYTEGFQWYASDPESGTMTSIYEIPQGIEIISDGSTSKLNIYDVPAWMDGWQVFCSFVGALGGKSNSTPATLHVKALPPPATPEPTETPKPTPSPLPSPSPMPSPSPLPSPSPMPTPPPMPTPEPVHVHAFPDSWSADDQLHWRECECGERIEQGAHVYAWTLTEQATRAHPGREKGVCSVCGHETQREIAYDSQQDVIRFVTDGVIGLVGLTVVVLVVDSVIHSMKKKH